MVSRLNGPFIISKKLDKGAVVLRLNDGTETIANVNRIRVFKGHPPDTISESQSFLERERAGSDDYDMDLGSVVEVCNSSSRSSFQEDQSKISDNLTVSEGTPGQMDIDVENADVSSFSDTTNSRSITGLTEN
jgi:hypothetical protein